MLASLFILSAYFLSTRGTTVSLYNYLVEESIEKVRSDSLTNFL